MGKPLIIVESPTKARTIKKFLPARYAVRASVGHVRDLPKSTLGVDVENDFAPRYLTIKGKGDIIKELRSASKGASEVYLATDPDREGEAIAWHLAELLKLQDPKRIELHEITKDAALEALRHPHSIDMDRVNAQQARRILDRLVGYKISPLLWAKVRGGLSAGRVQSVAVKLIVDREREIRAFTAREYWTVTAHLSRPGSPPAFAAELLSEGRKAELPDGETAARIVAELERSTFGVASVKQREVRRNPSAPFTTSTLQQEASRKLKLRVRRTMQLAQQLYEGVDLGKAGTEGLITYMRTDSTRIADSAKDAARRFIEESYGPSYYGGERTHRLRAGAQDAHEAIRPTLPSRTPDQLAGVLKRDELRVYRLIWERFVASQMAAAVFDQTTVDIAATRPDGPAHSLRVTGSVMKFPGFMAVYEEGRDDETSAAPDATSRNGARPARDRVLLPALAEGDPLAKERIEPKQHFTEPPPRYTEATLVKALEENGIGRPSTYSSIVETIQARQYAHQVERRFVPTEIGEAVNDLLAEHFKDIMDLQYTARVERDLDLVEEKKADWVEVLRKFYGPFRREFEEAERKLPKLEVRDEPSDEVCENCGRPMVIKTGRFGRFISCTGYPECRTTKPILKDTGAICPKDGGKVVERKSRRGRTFYGCANYPACDFVSWDRVVPERCPVCGSHVVAKSRRGVTSFECAANREHDVSAIRTAQEAESEREAAGV